MRPWQAAVATIAIGILLVLAQSEVATHRTGRPLQREFMAFYTVGYVLNRSPEALYDPDAFNRTYHALFPAVPADIRQLYGAAESLRLRWQGVYTLTNLIALHRMRRLGRRACPESRP